MYYLIHLENYLKNIYHTYGILSPPTVHHFDVSVYVEAFNNKLFVDCV